MDCSNESLGWWSAGTGAEVVVVAAAVTDMVSKECSIKYYNNSNTFLPNKLEKELNELEAGWGQRT